MEPTSLLNLWETMCRCLSKLRSLLRYLTRDDDRRSGVGSGNAGGGGGCGWYFEGGELRFVRLF